MPARARKMIFWSAEQDIIQRMTNWQNCQWSRAGYPKDGGRLKHFAGTAAKGGRDMSLRDKMVHEMLSIPGMTIPRLDSPCLTTPPWARSARTMQSRMPSR